MTQRGTEGREIAKEQDFGSLRYIILYGDSFKSVHMSQNLQTALFKYVHLFPINLLRNYERKGGRIVHAKLLEVPAGNPQVHSNRQT